MQQKVERMVTVRGRHFETLELIEVKVEGERIASIQPCEDTTASQDEPAWIAPGFFDIQINGYAGIWFCSPDLTVDDVETVTKALLTRGVTRYFPTLITASQEALLHGFTILKQACDERPVVADCVAGYHLEGPYISPDDGPRGAHPRQHVRPASWEEFEQLQNASGNRIRLVTIAAEAENAVPFIHRCCESGVVVALGHTGASPEQIRAAVDAGAQLSTHFGNGAHAVLPRHPNYLWEQLADQRLWASVIADGWHVPPSVLQCVMHCKTPQHTILTCDVSGFAGCDPGVYEEGEVAVEVLDDGRVVVAGQRQFLAGSGATTGDCVVRMSAACERTLAECVGMATTNPANLFGERLPRLAAGEPATFTQFGSESAANGEMALNRFIPFQTFLRGKAHPFTTE